MGHKRKRGQMAAESTSQADGTKAEAQSLSKSARAKARRKKRPRDEEVGGDTPKAFLSVMRHRELIGKSKLDSKAADQWKKDVASASDAAMLAPRPGEMMSDFNRRVDAAMPIKYTKNSNNSGHKLLDVEDFAEKRAKKQSAKQKKQNEEHLNMLKNKHERQFETTDKDFDDYEFSALNKGSRGRKKSPDPWAVLLRPERSYKFNESVEAPPTLTNKGKFVKKVVPAS